jgi:hypothetical protein
MNELLQKAFEGLDAEGFIIGLLIGAALMCCAVLLLR